jgi:hypothetical protein
MSSVLLFGLLNAGAFFLFPIEYSIVLSSILSIPIEVVGYLKQNVTKKVIKETLESFVYAVVYDIIYYYGCAQIQWKRITDLLFDTKGDNTNDNTNTNDEMDTEIIYDENDVPVSIVFKPQGSDLYLIGNIKLPNELPSCYLRETYAEKLLMLEVVLPSKDKDEQEEEDEKEEVDEQEVDNKEEVDENEEDKDDEWERQGQDEEKELEEGEVAVPEKEFRLLIQLKGEGYNYYSIWNCIDGNFMVYFLRRYYPKDSDKYSDEEIRNSHFHILTKDLKEYTCKSFLISTEDIYFDKYD